MIIFERQVSKVLYIPRILLATTLSDFIGILRNKICFGGYAHDINDIEIFF